MPLPNILEFIGNSVTQAGFKTAQEKLLNFLSGEVATKVELSAAVTQKADKTYVDNVLGQFQSDSSKFYATLAEANADIANIMPKLATDNVKDLVNIGEVTNGGTWYKASSAATSLSKSPYDPLIQAKEYASNLSSPLNAGIVPISEMVDIKSQATINSYLNLSGIIGPNDTNWRSSDFIEIKRIGKISVNAICSANNRAICFYDADKNLISRFGTQSGTSKFYTADLKVPENSKYIRFTVAASLPEFTSAQITSQYLKIVVYRNVYSFDKFDEIDTKIDNLEIGSYDFDVDLWGYATLTGYYKKTGQIAGTGDTNWVRSDLLNIKRLMGELSDIARINLRCTGHTDVGSLLFFNENRSLIIAYGASTNTALYTGEFEIPENAVYVAVSGGSSTINGGIKDPHAVFNNKLFIVKEVLSLMSGQSSKENYSLLTPVSVYTTCNDVGVAQNKGRLRNYSAAIYLDHFLNALTSEKNIRFKDAVDRFIFTSSLVVTDANENAPAINFNEGVNAKEVLKTIKITGNDIFDTQVNIKHRSVLNSVTASTKPRILCIGDSITYGEQALIPDDNYAQNHCYHLIAKELFMKDKIDNSNNGFDVLFLGTKSKSKTFTYNGNTQTVDTKHEGIRGISLSQHLSGVSTTEFWDSANSKWSVNAWLSKYRTLDDNGNRLMLGNGTGSLINSNNLNSIDVCTPTHVVIALGMNGGGTLEQYQQMINTLRTEIHDVKIALVVMPVSGTYFPSLHPNCSEKSVFWNNFDNIVSKRNQQYNLLKMFQDNFSESDNIYILPFFHTTPTAEGVASRKSNLIDGEYSSVLDSKHIEHFGWGANVHTNGLGHINWGYQLYSWIKWTIAKSV